MVSSSIFLVNRFLRLFRVLLADALVEGAIFGHHGSDQILAAIHYRHRWRRGRMSDIGCKYPVTRSDALDWRDILRHWIIVMATVHRGPDSDSAILILTCDRIAAVARWHLFAGPIMKTLTITSKVLAFAALGRLRKRIDGEKEHDQYKYPHASNIIQILDNGTTNFIHGAWYPGSAG